MARSGFLSTARSAVGAVMSSLGGSTPRRVSPFEEAGASGTAVVGGYVETKERNSKLTGESRYVTFSDMLANVSIIAAGIRYFANLVSRPSWKVEPARDNGPDEEPSDAAKAAAEFVEHVLGDLDANWTRIIRRSSMYRFYGFGIHEWTAKRRPDGLIGMASIEPRPCHSIQRWEVEPTGSVLGVWQRSPQTGQELWIPRPKFIYLLDDTLTDSPEGMGVLRQLVDPAERMQRYLKLEGTGYERDLRGIPVGHAPIGEINAAVAAGAMTAEQGQELIAGLKKFVQMQVKEDNSGLLLDSTPYEGQSNDGITVSSAKKWDLSLLSSSGSGFADISKAIERLRYDMAITIGVEGLLVGAGTNGSRSLSEDKSRNLTLQANACIGDMAEGFERDFIGALWTLNGLPDELKPTLKVEDVAFKDAEAVAAVLRDMSTAGAVLDPDDPVINDVRDLLGVSAAPEMTAERYAMLNPPPIVVGAPGGPGEPPPGQIGGPPTGQGAGAGPGGRGGATPSTDEQPPAKKPAQKKARR
jgi:hypothetical protein